MDMDEYVAVASPDLSAAFDIINVDLLLHRLDVMGMPKDLIKLLASWLTDRASYMEVDDNCRYARGRIKARFWDQSCLTFHEAAARNHEWPAVCG